MMLGHYASYETSHFDYSNSIAYIASMIGSIRIPVLVGKLAGTDPCAICTQGEWGIRLQHVSEKNFQLDVVSFSKKAIERILAIDPEKKPDGRFRACMHYFNVTKDFCDTDINSIPFLDELYYDFPIRELFQALNEFCDHCLDGQDADFNRPSKTVITASARQFLSGRRETSCRDAGR